MVAPDVSPAGEPISNRPAARVLCVSDTGLVLLLKWYDTVDAVTFWEPPGGGVEVGETPLAAARRELHEETGLPAELVDDTPVPVARDFRWLGVRYRKVEQFFLARLTGEPVIGARSLTEEEKQTFRGYRWFSPTEIARCVERVEPPHLLSVLAAFGIR